MFNKKMLLTFVDFMLALLFPLRSARSRSLANLVPERVLFCRVDHIGDVYLSLPALALVRERYPNAHLVVLAPSWAESLFRIAHYHDELLICDPPWWVSRRQSRFGGKRGQGGWLALCKTILNIRRYRFDLCIEMRGDVRQILAFGVLAGAKHILSRVRNGGAVLADRAPQIDENLHECQQNLMLLTELGIEESEPQFPVPYFTEDAARVTQLLSDLSPGSEGISVLIHPGAKWVNCWPAERYEELLANLGSEFPRMRVFLTGTKSEAPLCEQIARRLPGRAFSLAGCLTLTETAALMAMVDFVIMADTGPMHFLNAIDTEAVLLFGPTPELRFRPYGEHIRSISSYDCCEKALHETCTRVEAGQPSDCMMQIASADVLSLVRERLSQEVTVS